MKRLAILLAPLVLAGCFWSKPVTPPGNAPSFSGDPTTLVVTLKRDAVAGQAIVPQALALQAEPSETATVTISKGNQYRIHRTIALDPNENETAIEVEIPSGQGYDIAAVVYTDDRMDRVGRSTNVSAPDDTPTTVTVQLGEPEYTLSKPNVAYSGGAAKQFVTILSPTLRTFLYESSIRLGLEEWSSVDEHYALYLAGKGWFNDSSSFFPEVTEPTPLYYQVTICALPGYFATDPPCFYFPPMGETLPHITILPSPD